MGGWFSKKEEAPPAPPKPPPVVTPQKPAPKDVSDKFADDIDKILENLDAPKPEEPLRPVEEGGENRERLRNRVRTIQEELRDGT